MKVIGQIIEYLYARERLTRQDIAYLDAEGFLDNLAGEFEYDIHDLRGWNTHAWEIWEDLEEAKKYENLAESSKDQNRLNRKGSRPQAAKGALKAVDIRDRIVERRPSWAATLSPIVSLARRIAPSATLETAPLLIRDADSAMLLQAMRAELKAIPNWFDALWDALQFEDYRQCGGSGGNADNAYRAILTARCLPDVAKYAWILRHSEIAWVHTLLTVQQQLTRLCGALFDTQFPLIDSYLTQTYRSKAFWPYTLLYSAHRYALGTHTTQPTQERRLPIDAMPAPSCFAAAWEFALEMKREEALPFMVYTTRTQEPAAARADAPEQTEDSPFLCPSRWYKPY